jgi:hypothetical protein
VTGEDVRLRASRGKGAGKIYEDEQGVSIQEGTGR